MLIPHLKIVDWWPDYRFGEAPVDDAPLVRGFKGFGDLLRDWDCFVDRVRAVDQIRVPRSDGALQ